MSKNLVLGPIFSTFGPNSSHHFFSFKNLAASVTRYHSQLSSCTISGTNDPILRKLSDRWMERPKDGWRNRGTRMISQDAERLTKHLMAKNLVSGPILALLTKTWVLNKNVDVISLKFTGNTTPNIINKYIISTFFYSK